MQLGERYSNRCPGMCKGGTQAPGGEHPEWRMRARGPRHVPRISRTTAAPQRSRAEAVCPRWRDAGSSARWEALRTAWLPLQGGWKALWWDAVAAPPDVRNAREFREGMRRGVVLSPAWCARGPVLWKCSRHRLQTLT